MASSRASRLCAICQTTVTATQQRLPVTRNHTSCTLYRPHHGTSPQTQLALRSFHASSPVKAVHDSSSIDFAYMPQYELIESSPPEIIRIPLLPNNFFPPRRSEAQQETVESVIRPEISTVSADSTHIASPSAMSEVTDNHAIELDPYDLTSKVTAAAARMAGMPVRKLKEPGVVQELWRGFLDDLLGSKKVLKA